MYTFIISVVVSFIIAGAIYGKWIKQNQLSVVAIVFIVTLICSSIVNGIVGKNIPYTLTHLKTKAISYQRSLVIEFGDSIKYDTIIDSHITNIRYYYYPTIKKNGDTVITNYIKVRDFDPFYRSDKNKLSINFLPEGDTIPYVSVYRYKKITNSKWVANMSLPGRGREFHVFLEPNEKNELLLEQINEKFFENEKEQVAKLN